MKKFISTIVAVAMLISLIPTANAYWNFWCDFCETPADNCIEGNCKICDGDSCIVCGVCYGCEKCWYKYEGSYGHWCDVCEVSKNDCLKGYCEKCLHKYEAGCARWCDVCEAPKDDCLNDLCEVCMGYCGVCGPCYGCEKCLTDIELKLSKDIRKIIDYVSPLEIIPISIGINIPKEYGMSFTGSWAVTSHLLSEHNNAFVKEYVNPERETVILGSGTGGIWTEATPAEILEYAEIVNVTHISWLGATYGNGSSGDEERVDDGGDDELTTTAPEDTIIPDGTTTPNVTTAPKITTTPEETTAETTAPDDTTSGNGDEESYKLGDVNGDGEVTIADAVEILKSVAKLPSAIYESENSYKAACIVGDEPTIVDAIEVLKAVAGLDSLVKGAN